MSGGKRIDLREGINRCPAGATNLFYSPNWNGGVDNTVLDAAIIQLELSGILGEKLNPLEKLGALILVMQWENKTGQKVEGESHAGVPEGSGRAS